MSKIKVGDKIQYRDGEIAPVIAVLTHGSFSVQTKNYGVCTEALKIADGDVELYWSAETHIPVHSNILPEDDDARAAILLATCLLDYFPNACAAVAAHSAKSNAKHNPGQSPHWARDKSTGHRDKIVRHLIDAGGFDKDGNRHSTALAWRGLALLEDELIAEGATPGRNAKGSPDALTNPQHNCIEDEV